MTVVIAVRCANRVLMASDSQATEGEGNVRRETQKIFPLGQTAVWGGAGAGQIIRDMRLALSPHDATIAASPDPVLAIARIARPVYVRHYPAGQPWIGEVSAHLDMTHYEEIGFHAIGIGAVASKPFADLLRDIYARYPEYAAQSRLNR